MIFRSIAAFGLAGFVLCGVAACSDASDAIENTVTCSDVCERYQECVNEDYDVDSCTNRCEAEASSSEEKEAKLESCESCIDDRSCSGAVFNCATECAGVINP